MEPVLMMRPGEPRLPGQSVQDILRADGERQPPAYTTVSDVTIPNAEVGFERYTSQEFFDLEMERMWPRTWQWVCREEHIPEPGDYYVYDIGRYSFIIIRTKSRAIKAYYNACLHRGTKLKPSASEGSANELRCPFHGWAWSLDGDLVRQPCAWEFQHLSSQDLKLPEARVGSWGGFVFLNMDSNAIPLDEYLAPLPDHAKGLENRYVALHIQKELNCNWKIASEAFVESYHVLETHPQLLVGNGHVGQYDVYSDHVNRLFIPSAVPAGYFEKKPTEQEMLDSMVLGDRSMIGDKLTVPEGGSARKVMAQYFRDLAGGDVSKLSTTEVIDTLNYLVFPNGQFFPSVTFPVFYRFRPLDMSPHRTLYDLLLLNVVPEGSPRPPPAEPIRIKHEQSYTTVPGVDAALGHIFDQDTANMAWMHEGMQASKRKTAVSAEYQEVRIRHIHQTLDKYLARTP